MNRTRLAPGVGILACLAFLTALAFPFSTGAVSVYYSSGTLNPLLGGLLALIAVIVLAAGRQERTDPALAAGVGFALGMLITVITVVWFATVRTDAISITWLHRYGLTGTAIVIPIAAAWYARELGVS